MIVYVEYRKDSTKQLQELVSELRSEDTRSKYKIHCIFIYNSYNQLKMRFNK